MMTDLRHALRIIWRAPVLAAVVICSLGIGIGVNTAVFSWIQALVLRPLPGVANATDFYLIEPRSDGGIASRLVVARVPRSSVPTDIVS